MNKSEQLRYQIQRRLEWRLGCGPTVARWMRAGIAIVAVAGVLPVSADESLYDNLAVRHRGDNSELFFPGPPPTFFDLFAQPFELGDNDSVSSVSLRLGRWDGTAGPVSGPMRFSIWNDDGSGLPGQEVGELGVVEVSTLPNFKPNPPSVLETVVLDTPITGLVPMETYYLIADSRELTGLGEELDVMKRDSVVAPFLSRSTGTNEAGALLISHDAAAIQWESIQPFAGRRFLQMAVNGTTAPVDYVLYDNLEFETEHYVNVLGNDRRHAQQFLMDDHSSVEEVTVSLSRQGTASGSVAFEIWSDNGSDTPLKKITDLGTIADVGQIPTTETDFTFDSRTTGLDSGEEYWVVADYTGLNEPLDESNSIGWTLVLSDEGAKRTANANGSVDSGESWLDLGEAFGVDGPFKFKMAVASASALSLQAGDADQDLDFDQFDLVHVQMAAKYLSGQAATWGEGDWDGAPGGSAGSPPAGDGLFNQIDIVAAQQAAIYLSGTYAAIEADGSEDDTQTSVVYDPATGELAVDAPAGMELTSINVDSAAGIFVGDAAQNLGGSFDNDANDNIFKATFGSSFGSTNFGNVAQAGLLEEYVLNDLTVIGSLSGGGDLGAVDLVYVPEPTSVLLFVIGFVIGLAGFRRVGSRM